MKHRYIKYTTVVTRTIIALSIAQMEEKLLNDGLNVLALQE